MIVFRLIFVRKALSLRTRLLDISSLFLIKSFFLLHLPFRTDYYCLALASLADPKKLVLDFRNPPPN